MKEKVYLFKDGKKIGEEEIEVPDTVIKRRNNLNRLQELKAKSSLTSIEVQEAIKKIIEVLTA